MVVLSFLQRGEVWGVVNSFTLDNYKNILTPIYLQTFAESFKLAITSTVFITLLAIRLAILWPNCRLCGKSA